MNKFNITFNDRPKIDITGDIGTDYLIEIYEYRKLDKELIVDFKLSTNNFICFLREWYGDYEIQIYDWNIEKGLYLVHSHRYDDKNKEVLINLDTIYLYEALIWLSKAIEYKNNHGCKLTIKSQFKEHIIEIDSSIKVIEELKNPEDYYAIYNIGKYDTEYEWNKRLTDTVLDQVWHKNRTFCSYRNPRDWHTLSLDDVAADILGLNEI